MIEAAGGVIALGALALMVQCWRHLAIQIRVGKLDEYLKDLQIEQLEHK